MTNSMLEIRSLCSQMMRFKTWSQDVKDISRFELLQSELRRADTAELQQWADFIVYPFIELISAEELALRHREHVLATLNLLLSRIQLSPKPRLNLFCHSVLLLIRHESPECFASDIQNEIGRGNEPLNLSEECLLSVAELWSHLVNAQLVDSVLVGKSRGALSVYLKSLLEWPVRYQSLALKEKCLSQLVALMDLPPAYDLLSEALPAIIVHLHQLLVCSKRTSSIALVKGLRCLRKILTLVFDDDGQQSDSARHDRIQACRSRLARTLSTLSPLRSSAHVNVQLALVDCCHCVLRQCSTTLGIEHCLYWMLETLLISINSDLQQLSFAAHKALSDLSKRWQIAITSIVDSKSESRSTVAEEIVILFDRALGLFGSSMKSVDDDKRLLHITVLNGYLNWLGNSHYTLLSSHLKNVMDALEIVLLPDTADLSLVRDRQSDKQHGYHEVDQRPRLYFTNFNSEDLHRELLVFIQYLAKHATFSEPIIDELLQGLGGPTYRVSKLLIFHELAPFIHRYRFDSSYIGFLSEQLLSGDVLGLPTAIEEFQVDSAVTVASGYEKGTLGDFGENVITIQYALLAAGRLMNCVDRTELDGWLLKSIYPLVECIEHGNRRISSAAIKTLDKVAARYGLADASRLIQENIDYILNTMDRRLRYLDMYPRTARVLCSLVQHAKEDVGPEYFQASTNRIMDWLSCGSLSHEHTLELLRCMRILLDRSRQKYTEEQNGTDLFEEMAQRQVSKAVSFNEAQSFINPSITQTIWDKASKPMQKFIIRASRSVYSDVQTEAACGVEDERPNEPKLSYYGERMFSLAEQCSKIAVHYVTADHVHLRQSALQLFTSTVAFTSIKPPVFLASLREGWGSFLGRLDDTEHVVVLAAIDMLTVVLGRCGSFMSSEVANGLIPRILALLNAHQSCNVAELKKSTYIYSVSYRIQLKLFHLLAEMFKGGVRLKTEITPLLDSLRFYLTRCDKLPKPLSVACTEALQAVYLQHGDLVVAELIENGGFEMETVSAFLKK